jgi:hypothetical protein
VHGAVNDPRGSILVPRLGDIRALGKRAFPVAGTLPGGLDTIPEDADGPATTKLPRVSCYAPPPPPPTARPTAVATHAPTQAPSGATAPPASEGPASPTEPPATEEPPPTQKPGGGPKTPEPTLPPDANP